MLALFRTLLNQMGQKAEIYDELIRLLRREWDSIANYSYDGMQEIMNKKETLVLKMQVLEENRAEVVRVLASRVGLSVEEATLKRLIDFCPAHLKRNLVACRKRLLAQIKAIADLNVKNQGLLDASSLSIKKSLAFLHKSQDVADAAYQVGGKLIEGRSPSRMLSMQA